MQAGWEPAIPSTGRAPVSFSTPAPPPTTLPTLPPLGFLLMYLICASPLPPWSCVHSRTSPGPRMPCSSLYTPPAFPGILLLLFGDCLCSQKNSGTVLPQRNKFVHYDGYMLCLTLARPWCPDYGVKHSACFFL